MKKNAVLLALISALLLSVLAGCGGQQPQPSADAGSSVSSKTDSLASVTETVDSGSVLRHFLKNELIPKYGLMDVQEMAVPTKPSEEFIDVSEINGVLSGALYDLDKDGEEELIVLRYVSAGDTTHMFTEIYEANGGKPERSDYLDLSTRAFAWSYHDIRTALFLSDDENGDPLLNIYVSNSVNENCEILRQYRYENKELVFFSGNMFWTGGDYWCHWAESAGRENDTALTVHTPAKDGKPWKAVKALQIGDDRSDAKTKAYKDEENALFGLYRKALEPGGLVRNEKRFGPANALDDYDSATKHTAASCFDNKDDLKWIALLDAPVSYNQVNIFPVDCTKLARS